MRLHLMKPGTSGLNPSRPAPTGPKRHLAPVLAGMAAATLILGVLVPAAHAGRLSPALQDELSRLAPSDPVTVLVTLEQQAPIGTLNEALKIQGVSRATRHRMVVEQLQGTARRTQAPLVGELDALVAAGRVTSYKAHWISNLVQVRGSRSAIEELAARLDIAVVEQNPKPVLIGPVSVESAGKSGERSGATPGVKACRAPDVWNHLGINGTGVLVANMDTGVDVTHPSLGSRWRGLNGAHPWQECWLDVLGTNTTVPTDNGEHGTHVMGTITGLDPISGDSIGVAPGAQWIACNPIDQPAGDGFDPDIVACFEWLADPDGNPNTIEDVPNVVQNSWGVNEGMGHGYTDCDPRWWSVIDNCEAAGVCVIFSAGNEGPAGRTLRSPSDHAATVYNVFSVGAVDATNFSWPYPIASFSSRGPTGCNVDVPLRIKPEIAAPGVHVYSAKPGGSYQYMDGTSMAGPHVTGVVALMCQANPDLSVDQLKQVLMDTARDEGTAGEDNTYGWGMVDALQAVVRCLNSPTSSVLPGAVAAATLLESRPNPFSGSTEVGFRLAAPADVKLAVFDPAGRLVRTLLSAPASAGEHRVTWDGRDDLGRPVAAGAYFSSLSANGATEQRKILVVR